MNFVDKSAGLYQHIFDIFHYMLYVPPCPPIDSILILMTVWRITGKIIGTTIMFITYACV